ncbi:MAG TPA: hypothetical protein VF571_08715 [Pyrinomonadaceae bacterium]|jgi:hypothetical protein
MLLTDTNEKTARIPVKFIDGKFINQITGEEVREIKNEAECEITVEANKVSDEDFLSLLSDEEGLELLPAESILYVSVNSKHIPENLRRFTSPSGDNERFVEIKLITPLWLKFRGTKPPSLLDCNCDIPSLRETDENYEPAKSVNHAYRLISTAFEPNRRSFGGSVFLKVTVPPQGEIKRRMKLGDLREREIDNYFEKLKVRYKEQAAKKTLNK